MSKLERYIPTDSDNPKDVVYRLTEALGIAYDWQGTIFHETVEAAKADYAKSAGTDLTLDPNVVVWKLTLEKVEA